MKPAEPFWRRQATALDGFMLRIRRQGFVTLSELTEVLPDGELDPDEVEDFMSMLSEMGIHVVEDT